MKTFTALVVCLFVGLAAMADEHVLEFEGKDGPGKGKTIVLISGDEEYRSEEAMPLLAKILSQHHGFDCKVLFAWDNDGTYIDPNNQAGIRGWEELKTADLMIIGTRFRRPTAEDAQHLTDFMNAGKPIIGLRTSTHGFIGGGRFGGKIGYTRWGKNVLGVGWDGHHGKHKAQGARGVIEDANRNHPILRGVTNENVFAPSDVYRVRGLEEQDIILMRGAVTETLDPSSPNLESEKNNPMQPSSWLRPYTAPNGTKGTSFCTTMGASVDLVSEGLRRIIVNAAFYLNGLEVPPNANVADVDPFYPTFYGFIKDTAFWPTQNKTVADFGLGKSPSFPDPEGTPKWDFRQRSSMPFTAANPIAQESLQESQQQVAVSVHLDEEKPFRAAEAGFEISRNDTTILCIGDSITEGGKTFSVYRYPLNKKLMDAGYNITFIGPKSATKGGVTLSHAGYGGKKTASLDKLFNGIYAAHTADIILIHSAHNSFHHHKPVKGIVANLESIVKKARAVNPKVTLLLGQGITSGKLPKYSYIPQLNVEVGELAKRLHTEDSIVMAVDHATGFDWKTDTTKDKVHPNAQGAEKMASKWFEALEKLPQLKKGSGGLTAANPIAQESLQQAAVSVHLDEEKPFRAAEAGFEISRNDLLSGARCKSNLKLQSGTDFGMTDGSGGHRVFAAPNEQGDPWVVEFSDLRIQRLEEIRVFSWNRDTRARQDYDVAVSSDGGSTWQPVATGVTAKKSGALAVTRVVAPFDAVTNLRFTFREVRNNTHSAILEIDALGEKIPPTAEELRRAAIPVELQKGDTICVIGNSLADRMQHDGWLEAVVQSETKGMDLSWRDMGYSGDTLMKRARSRGSWSAEQYLSHAKADVIFAFFGYNESFSNDTDQFEADLKKVVGDFKRQKFNGSSTPQIVLFSPIAFENHGVEYLPDGKEHNERLAKYTASMEKVAKELDVGFVDLFNPSARLYASAKSPLTLNGVHLTAEGNRQLAEVIGSALFSKTVTAGPSLEKLRGAVLDKNWYWHNRYRATDGNDIWGGRSKLSFVDGQTNAVVLQHELTMLDVMTANRDKRVWAVANGGDLKVDDSNVPAPIPVKSNIGGNSESSSADKEGTLSYFKPAEALSMLEPREGFTANLFADEERFPEMINPVQLGVGPKGRLWAAVWPTYPKWEPFKEMNDALLILPDDNGDGVADKVIEFAKVDVTDKSPMS